MWMIEVENACPRLRGTLSRWGIEVRAGLYVGSGTGKIRDAIWEHVVGLARHDTSAVLVHDDPGPQGFAVRTHGPNRREIVDVDGMSLARFFPPPRDTADPATLAPEATRFDPWEWEDVDEEYLEP